MFLDRFFFKLRCMIWTKLMDVVLDIFQLCNQQPDVYSSELLRVKSPNRYWHVSIVIKWNDMNFSTAEGPVLEGNWDLASLLSRSGVYTRFIDMFYDQGTWLPGMIIESRPGTSHITHSLGSVNDSVVQAVVGSQWGFMHCGVNNSVSVVQFPTKGLCADSGCALSKYSSKYKMLLCSSLHSCIRLL